MPARTVLSPRPRRSVRRGLRRLAAVLTASALLASVPVGLAQADDGGSSAGARYVALGDSFSSGEGLFLYRTGTDTTTDRCHRSPLAYASLLSHTTRRLRSLAFVACSGAVTSDLYRANHLYPSEAPQLAALSTRTRTVTLTLGGNDIGFSQVLGACIRPRALAQTPCSTDPRITGGVAAGLAALAGTRPAQPVVPMAKVLTDIAAQAPNATIYLAGYPELFGDSAADYAVDPAVGSGRSCSLLDTGVPATTPVLDYADAQFLNASTRQLDAVLSTAVAQVRATGVRARYVPVPVFAGHGLCDAKRSWINPLIPSDTGSVRPESLHPDLLGSIGYAQSFWTAFPGSRALPASVRREAGLR